MNHQRRRSVVLACLGLAAIGACTRKERVSDTTQVSSAADSLKKVRDSILATLDPADQRSLKAISIDPGLTGAGLGGALSATPPSGKKHNIRVLARDDCKDNNQDRQYEVRLEVQAVQYAGGVPYSLYRKVPGRWHLAVVKNESHCFAKRYEIPPKTTVYWYLDTDGHGGIVSTLADGNGVMVTTPTDTLAECGDGTTPAGDEAMPKKFKNGKKHEAVCNHIPEGNDAPIAMSEPAPLVRFAAFQQTQQPQGGKKHGPPPPPAYDDWTLWIACGPDCCYSDP